MVPTILLLVAFPLSAFAQVRQAPPGDTARQQAEAPSVRGALDCFDEMTRLGKGNCESPWRGSILAYLSGHSQYGPQARDSVLDGLAELALSSDSRMVRAEAAGWLAFPGDGDYWVRSEVPSPLVSGIVDRMASVYRRSDDPVVRGVVVGRMAHQRETARAIDFLEEVAREDRPEDRASGQPPQSFALDALARMGEEGRAALRRLHAEGAVTNPAARDFLEYLARHDFRLR